MTFPLLPGVAPSCFAPCRPTSACLSPSASRSFRFLLLLVCCAPHNVSKYNQACLPPLLPLPLAASSSSQCCLTNLSVPRQSDLTRFYITIQSVAPSTSSAQRPKRCVIGMDAVFSIAEQHIIRCVQPESWLLIFRTHQICFSESAWLCFDL